MKRKKAVGPAESDTAKVNEFMNQLDHPLKAEMEAVRANLLNANSKISERIKWNAPSFYYREDIATFNPRAKQHVHIVFHYAPIVNIKSDLLTGDYKDRRMVYLRTMSEVESNKAALEKIMNELIDIIDKQIINQVEI